MNRPRWTSWLIRVGALFVAAVLFWWAPLFHIVSLKAANKRSADAAFNAPAFVEKFWNDQLLKAAERAPDAAVILEAIRKDPKTAKEKYGRTASLGGSTYYYFISGEGRVIAANERSISLAVIPGSTAADVVLETGNIFGNAIRDGTGLIDVSAFGNSQDFNAISSEIDHHVETQVLPELRKKAGAGATVHFAGCAEIIDEDSDLHPLHIIPITAAVR